MEVLAEFCTREITEGINGAGVRAGAIKLAASNVQFTPAEEKAFRAGARAQKATGVHITTHCTELGGESTQLALFDKEGVDLSRVVIGHTGPHLIDPAVRQTCLEWMRRGANFMPTNLAVYEDHYEDWRPLVEAIHAVFDAGFGDKLLLGTDGGYFADSGPFRTDPRFGPAFLQFFTRAAGVSGGGVDGGGRGADVGHESPAGVGGGLRLTSADPTFSGVAGCSPSLPRAGRHKRANPSK